MSHSPKGVGHKDELNSMPQDKVKAMQDRADSLEMQLSDKNAHIAEFESRQTHHQGTSKIRSWQWCICNCNRWKATRKP